MKAKSTNKLSPIKRKLRKLYLFTPMSLCNNLTTRMTNKKVNTEALRPWSLALRYLYLYFEGQRMDPET